jgi:hypothetical protein
VANPVPIPDPPQDALVLIPVTLAFWMVTLPMPECAPAGTDAVPIPADAEPPSDRIEPFTIARLPQTDPDGAPRPGPESDLVTSRPDPIAPTVKFEPSPHKTPPNSLFPIKSSVTSDLEILSELMEDTSRRRMITCASVMDDDEDVLPLTTTNETGSSSETPLHDNVVPLSVNPPSPLSSHSPRTP